MWTTKPQVLHNNNQKQTKTCLIFKLNYQNSYVVPSSSIIFLYDIIGSLKSINFFPFAVMRRLLVRKTLGWKRWMTITFEITFFCLCCQIVAGNSGPWLWLHKIILITQLLFPPSPWFHSPGWHVLFWGCRVTTRYTLSSGIPSSTPADHFCEDHNFICFCTMSIPFWEKHHPLPVTLHSYSFFFCLSQQQQLKIKILYSLHVLAIQIWHLVFILTSIIVSLWFQRLKIKHCISRILLQLGLQMQVYSHLPTFRKMQVI